MSKTIKHYGVKGMRWGVRRENPSGDSGAVGKKKGEVSKSDPDAPGGGAGGIDDELADTLADLGLTYEELMNMDGKERAAILAKGKSLVNNFKNIAIGEVNKFVASAKGAINKAVGKVKSFFGAIGGFKRNVDARKSAKRAEKSRKANVQKGIADRARQKAQDQKLPSYSRKWVESQRRKKG